MEKSFHNFTYILLSFFFITVIMFCIHYKICIFCWDGHIIRLVGIA